MPLQPEPRGEHRSHGPEQRVGCSGPLFWLGQLWMARLAGGMIPMAALLLGPPEPGREQRYAQSEVEAETRRLTYEFYDQLDCVDASDSSSRYEEWAEGAD